jgi:hypothetical protein
MEFTLRGLPGQITQGCLRKPVQEGVSKGEEDARRLTALQAGHPPNGRKGVWGVARPQGVEGLGMARPGETLGRPWIPLPVRA